MTNPQTQRLREAALRHYELALQAGMPFIGLEGDALKARLLPLWRKAFHRTIVEVGACGCVNADGACWLDWEEPRQLDAFASGHCLSFEAFCHTFNEGAAAALLILATTAHASHADT